MNKLSESGKKEPARKSKLRNTAKWRVKGLRCNLSQFTRSAQYRILTLDEKMELQLVLRTLRLLLKRWK